MQTTLLTWHSRVALAGSGRRHDTCVDNQAVAVLHQYFTEIGELGFVPFAFLDTGLSGSVVD